MSRKLLLNGFKWVEDFSEFNENFSNIYKEESNEENFLEIDHQYPENLHEPHNGLLILAEIKTVDKVKKVLVNLRDKKEDIIHIGNLKQGLNHRLVLKSIDKVTKFNEKLG